MIAPIAGYAIRGVIYYQGEYNSGMGREYREVMPAIFRSWRKRWGQGDFPFLFVQLPGYHEHLASVFPRGSGCLPWFAPPPDSLSGGGAV